MSASGSIRAAVPLVLLTGPLAPPGGAAGLRAAMERRGLVLVPQLVAGHRRPADLSGPALAVLDAVSAYGADQAVVCGVGYGAMVALQVAATHPRRVAGLVLSTAAVPVATAVRSLHGGAAALLPARTLQVLAGGEPVLRAVDQVRAVDYGPIVGSATSATLVLSGADDRLNVRAGEQLARALPDGTVVVVPGAGPGWIWSTPGRWADAAEPFLRAWTSS